MNEVSDTFNFLINLLVRCVNAYQNLIFQLIANKVCCKKIGFKIKLKLKNNIT